MDKIEQDLALCPAPPPPRRVARAEAAAVLQREGTLARMIAAWLLCLMSFFALMFVIQLFDVLAVQTDRLPGGEFDSDILFFVLRLLLWAAGLMFLIFPLWLGKLRLAGLMLDGGMPEMWEQLHFFGSLRLHWRAVRIWAVLTIQLLVPVVLVAGAYYGAFCIYEEMQGIMQGGTAVVALISGMVVATALAVLVLFWSGVWVLFAAVAVGNEKMPLTDAMRVALRGRHHLGEIFLFNLCTLWQLFLSLITVGVLFVLRYSHSISLSYLRLAKALCPKGEN